MTYNNNTLWSTVILISFSSYGGGPLGKTGNANGFIAAHADSIPVSLRDP